MEDKNLEFGTLNAIANLRQQLTDLQAELRAAREQVLSVTEDRDALQAKLASSLLALVQAGNEVEDLRKQLQNEEKALARSEEEEKRWREEAYRYKAEVQNLNHAIALQDDKVLRLESAVGVLQKEAVDREALIAARDTEAKELQKQLGALAAQLETAQAMLAEEKMLKLKCAQQVEHSGEGEIIGIIMTIIIINNNNNKWDLAAGIIVLPLLLVNNDSIAPMSTTNGAQVQTLEKELEQSRQLCKAEVLAHFGAKEEIAYLQARLKKRERELGVIPTLQRACIPLLI